MIELKKQLLDNPEHIRELLEEYDFHNIKINSNEIRCGVEEDTNSTSVRIRLEKSLKASDFGRDYHGDIFSLIMTLKDVGLGEIIKTTKDILGISFFEFNKKERIFGGFYDSIKKRKTSELKTLDNSILDNFKNKYNALFTKDGISLETQKKYQIGIDFDSYRISVPWFNFSGELVGIEGRYMGDYKEDEVSKWFPIIAFPKSMCLYGVSFNYNHLYEAKRIYIGESSKFSMQLDTMGIQTGVSLGGNAIHREQIKQLSWLNPEEIVFCFDEGLSEELVNRQIEKTKLMTKYTNIKVGIIRDPENKLLPKESKCSPTDLGKERFLELEESYLEWR